MRKNVRTPDDEELVEQIIDQLREDLQGGNIVDHLLRDTRFLQALTSTEERRRIVGDQVFSELALLKDTDVAELLGCSVSFVRSLRQSESGPPFKKIGKLVRYCRRDVLHWRDGLPNTNTPHKRAVKAQAS